MAKGASGSATRTVVKKKTSSSGNPSMIKKASMPKSKKASFKRYRGQGR